MPSLHIWAAVPALIATLGLGAFAVAEMAGLHPLTQGPARNMAEAVAMNDMAAVLRISVAQPGTVDDVTMVRAGLIGNRRTFVTPLEAAVMVRNMAAVEFLASRGAKLGEQREYFACLATDIGEQRLAARLHPAAGRTCVPGEALARVMDRP